MCRKELALYCILIQEAYVKKFFSKRAFLYILNVYSHSKLNTPVLIWSLQLSNIKQSCHQTFFSDYQMWKIPYKEISPLYLLYGTDKQTEDIKLITLEEEHICDLSYENCQHFNVIKGTF